MQGADGILDPGFIDDAGDPDFRGRNQLNIDALLAERAEHPGSITRGILHPGADDADLAQFGIRDDFFGVNRLRNGWNHIHGLF